MKTRYTTEIDFEGALFCVTAEIYTPVYEMEDDLSEITLVDIAIDSLGDDLTMEDALEIMDGSYFQSYAKEFIMNEMY